MWWQFIVLVLASVGFPVAVLLFCIGGPRFRDARGARRPGT